MYLKSIADTVNLTVNGASPLLEEKIEEHSDKRPDWLSCWIKVAEEDAKFFAKIG